MQSAVAEKRELFFSDDTDENILDNQSENFTSPEEFSPHENEHGIIEPRIETVEIDTAEDHFGTASTSYEFLKTRNKPLVPLIFGDLIHYCMVYVLAIAVCLFSLYKVYQVQQTRSLTATLNELNTNNDNLHKEWLSLLAARQSLSEHSVIRQQAVEKLAMVQPKTDDEIVIRID